MAGYVYIAFNNTNDNLSAIFDVNEREPPAKKKRGAASKYDFVEIVEELENVHQKAKDHGLKFKSQQGSNTYFICKEKLCTLKWRVAVNPDLDYSIFTTEGGHSHGAIERINGLSNDMKKLIDERITGNETTNSEAIVQAFRNKGWRELPSTIQVSNYVATRKKSLIPNFPNSQDICFADIIKLVAEILFEMIEQKFFLC